MTNEKAMKIALDLQKIALALDNATYYKIKVYLEDIERLVMDEVNPVEVRHDS